MVSGRRLEIERLMAQAADFRLLADMYERMAHKLALEAIIEGDSDPEALALLALGRRPGPAPSANGGSPVSLIPFPSSGEPWES